MNKLAFLALLTLLLASCSPQNNTPPSQPPDITDAMAGRMRFQAPHGTVAAEDQPKSVEIALSNFFPIWRENISVTVDVSIRNKTQSHLPARVMGHMFIYTIDDKQPVYWSNIDLAFGETAAPGIMSILSIPTGGSNELKISPAQIKWAPVDQKVMPDASIYELVPSGDYLLRFELDFYTDDDQIVGTAVSNFVQFSTVQAAPELDVPEEFHKKRIPKSLRQKQPRSGAQ